MAGVLTAATIEAHPGAGATELDRFAAETGSELPEELRAILSVSNGTVTSNKASDRPRFSRSDSAGSPTAGDGGFRISDLTQQVVTQRTERV